MKQNTASSPNRPATLSFEAEAPSGVRKRPPPASIRLDAIPRVALAEAELRRQRLDHRAGFLLAQIDGQSNVETLLDLSGMTRDEALGILDHLVSKGIVAFGEMRKTTPPPSSCGDRLVWGWRHLE